MIENEKCLKNKIYFFVIMVIMIVYITGCKKNNEANIRFPAIPDDYTVSKELYMSTGDVIFAFIENEEIDYAKIQSEIYTKNAEKVKKECEEIIGKENDPEKYVAIQNIIAITDIYLSNYKQAYERFNDTISFVEENVEKDKSKVLTVLYNNAGTATYYLQEISTVEELLEKASALCEEPYMGLVIAANQIIREKVNASVKQIGKAMMRADKLISLELKITDSINLVTYSAVRCWSAGYIVMGESEKAIKLLEEYIPLIPNSAEYNLIRTSLIGMKGNCYKELKEYEKAIEDIQNAIYFAEKTVNPNFKGLAFEYHKIAICYENLENWDKAIDYFELANPGYVQAMPIEKGALYYDEGCAYFRSGEYDIAKRYFLLSYVNLQEIIGKSDNDVVNELISDVKDNLSVIYLLDKTITAPFYEWLEQELAQIEEEAVEEETEKEETKS